MYLCFPSGVFRRGQMDVALTLAVKKVLEHLTAAFQMASLPWTESLRLKQARVDSSTTLAQDMKALLALDNFEVKGILPDSPGPTVTPRADCEECRRLWRQTAEGVRERACRAAGPGGTPLCCWS